MKQKVFTLFLVLLPLVFSVGCKNPEDSGDDNMPDNGKNIQVVNPKGGESFTVGETVTISLKVNANNILGVVPAVSINGGMTWNDIMSPQITPEAGGGGQLLTHDWVIGQEVNPVTYTGTLSECRVRVYNYNDKAEFDQSTNFTITGK